MIEIYAYYSVGGYKDLYLGNTEDSQESVFYSPLLSVWQNGQSFDEQTNRKMALLSKMPQIECLTSDSAIQLPPKVLSLETKGGYKCLLTSVEGGFSLIIREIENNSHDEYGRPVPFLLHFFGKDRAEMFKLGRYVSTHLHEFENILRELFCYNQTLNAIEFKLGFINSELKEILSATESEPDPKELDSPQYQIKFLVLVNPSKYKDVAEMIGIRQNQIFRIYGVDGALYLQNNITQCEGYGAGPFSPSFQPMGKQAVDEIHSDVSARVAFEGIRKLLSSFVSISEEDQQDLRLIKESINNIINRKKNQTKWHNH